MFDPLTVAAIALKTSLLVIAAALIATVIARRSAAGRHLLWTAALALSLLMPFAAAYFPSHVQVSLPWRAAESGGQNEPASAARGEWRTDADPAARGSRDRSIATAGHKDRAAWPAAMIVWLVGALAVLLRHAAAHVGLMRWVRQSRADLSPAWAATLRRVTSEAGFRRSLRVLESDRATSPCTWGLIRPTLLLPVAGADWPERQRRFALLHELAHVRRLDYLATQVSNLACAMHWYNPLVWFAAAQARRLQEHACDDAVLHRGEMPSDYAQFLVSVSGDSRRMSLAYPAAIGMARRSQLHGRVTAILDASRARLPLSRLALLVALAPLGCLALFLATITAVASPTATKPAVPLTASFSSVELRNGGMVTLVHGPVPRVTMLKGDPEESSITVDDDGRLVIDHCSKGCSRRHDFEVEVMTPALASVKVAHGGTIRSLGNFPPQPEIGLAVEQGGTVDARTMSVTKITASVYSGGRIFTKPSSALSAKVEQGGGIFYWGDAVVESSVQYGGVVVEGNAANADKPLAELMGPVVRSPPPVPPVPALEPIRK